MYTTRLFHCCLLFSMVLSSLLWVVGVQADPALIQQLSREIAQAKSAAEKSRLHMFRARNYVNIGDMEKAEEDYDAALAHDHKGWIHLERSRFYLGQNAYRQVVREARAAWKETPTLKNSAQQLIAHAEKELKKARNRQSPQEILLTRKWEVKYRRTPPSSAEKHVRQSSAARSKERAQQGPGRTARS